MKLIQTSKGIWQLIKDTFKGFFKDDPMSYSASIAFYTIFSLPAILIVVLAIAGSIYGEKAVTGELYYQIQYLMGHNTAVELQRIIQNATISDAGTIATIIAIGTLLFSATTVFVSVQNGLNKIWGVRAKPKKNWVKFIIDRLLSFTLVAFFGLLMIFSLVLDALVGLFNDILLKYLSEFAVYLTWILNFSISTIFTTIIFAMIFKLLPDAVIRWREVWVGAFITTLLFILGRVLINFYLANSDFGDTYGAAGSLVAILMWVYYSSVILLLGAQFTQVYAKQFGKIIVPTSNAVRIVEKEVHPTDPEALKD
ncbi:MAG: YihY/virulence factor BrkB family protein [Bacteroidota bacterium]|nr:YihY/virulence factor BrkB family protein [Bacteroidota bacterium]